MQYILKLFTARSVHRNLGVARPLRKVTTSASYLTPYTYDFAFQRRDAASGRNLLRSTSLFVINSHLPSNPFRSIREPNYHTLKLSTSNLSLPHLCRIPRSLQGITICIRAISCVISLAHPMFALNDRTDVSLRGY